MSKNVLMLVGGLAVIVVIVFWAQSVLIKSLQPPATLPETPPMAPATTAGSATAPGSTTTTTTTTQAPAPKKTTITKPVKKH